MQSLLIRTLSPEPSIPQSASLQDKEDHPIKFHERESLDKSHPLPSPATSHSHAKEVDNITRRLFHWLTLADLTIFVASKSSSRRKTGIGQYQYI